MNVRGRRAGKYKEENNGGNWRRGFEARTKVSKRMKTNNEGR